MNKQLHSVSRFSLQVPLKRFVHRIPVPALHEHPCGRAGLGTCMLAVPPLRPRRRALPPPALPSPCSAFPGSCRSCAFQHGLRFVLRSVLGGYFWHSQDVTVQLKEESGEILYDLEEVKIKTSEGTNFSSRAVSARSLCHFIDVTVKDLICACGSRAHRTVKTSLGGGYCELRFNPLPGAERGTRSGGAGPPCRQRRGSQRRGFTRFSSFRVALCENGHARSVRGSSKCKVPCASPAVTRVPSARAERGELAPRLRAAPVSRRLGAPGPTGRLQRHLRHNKFCFSASGTSDLVQVKRLAAQRESRLVTPPPASASVLTTAAFGAPGRARSRLRTGSGTEPGGPRDRQPAAPQAAGTGVLPHLLLQNQSLCPSLSVQSPTRSPRCRLRDPPREQRLYNVIKY